MRRLRRAGAVLLLVPAFASAGPHLKPSGFSGSSGRGADASNCDAVVLIVPVQDPVLMPPNRAGCDRDAYARQRASMTSYAGFFNDGAVRAKRAACSLMMAAPNSIAEVAAEHSKYLSRQLQVFKEDVAKRWESFFATCVKP